MSESTAPNEESKDDDQPFDIDKIIQQLTSVADKKIGTFVKMDDTTII